MCVLSTNIREIVYSANPLLSGQISFQLELEQSVIPDTQRNLIARRWLSEPALTGNAGRHMTARVRLVDFEVHLSWNIPLSRSLVWAVHLACAFELLTRQ